MKRKLSDPDPDATTPRKLRTRIEKPSESESETDDLAQDVQTPSRRKRGLQQLVNDTPRKSSLKVNGGINGHVETPKSQRKVLFATPQKAVDDDVVPNGTPTIVRNADRSARRKSARRLIERTINGDSDQEALEDEEDLAQQILGDEDEEETTEHSGAEEEIGLTRPAESIGDKIAAPETPVKRKRGRPKGSGKKKPEKQPTPDPEHLPAHEQYFWQNRPGEGKTSSNTLSAEVLLNHDEYFEAMQAYKDPHEPEREFLLELHSRAFDQWIFELDEGFNICLYGYGSKRPITEAFTAHLYTHLLSTPSFSSKHPPKIVVINGYNPSTTLKDILHAISGALLPPYTKLPAQPTALLSSILSYATSNPPAHPIPVIINSLDAPQLRRSPTPQLLSSLAAHPAFSLLCTADTPNFPLLWDVGIRSQFRFLFHDATTFAPYDVEIDAVETVNQVLGRSGRRVGGKDGVAYVLRSLPENARVLYRLLVLEQLALLYGGDDVVLTETGSGGGGGGGGSNEGVEYRTLYHKAVQEFICSSEVGFRTLLKEFHDHQMVESRKDGSGTERLYVPFRRDELEALVEDMEGV